ncbi:MAG: acyl-CoA dehydrogenase [Proteobacteria bacterium]|nr:acyl-CoA dehydrogenase [Pseudomonadota bacterium]MBU1389797.1 acyl-CoA dehydrogenase [Pseudomonadota bacterium]MBU1543806.1 acyl-CoA dehydrogenase [Pseudomonadota bacterium]MBU2479574.1 acyl-CoA dehydrogenase [Pseudomonadota bacterium]
MAQQLADRRDQDFVIWEQFDNEKLIENEHYKGFDRKTCEMIITEGRKLAIKEIIPTIREGDLEGVHLDNGIVTTPKSFKRVFDLLRDNDWGNLSVSTDMGGQGAPHFVGTCVEEYLLANWPLIAYLNTGIGTAGMIYKYGTKEQVDKYVPKLVSSEWTGTMLLTEPQAGSDLGAIETAATRNDDGTFSLSGGKIFITAGEHDLVDNIIHPVLARIEGAPAGTKGISIFIVPKYLVNDDGSLGERNDIWCTGVEHKHGIRASATCSMTLGAKGQCKGYLLGKENQGLPIMFNMMNGARMDTGLQALAYGSASYLLAVNYARERIQSREIGQPPTAPGVAIINHPDVKRNLLQMKSYVCGLRSFFQFTNLCAENAKLGHTQEERQLNSDLYELLTPLIKSYTANRSYEVCVQAMQVYGGAGYMQDYLVEQFVRDCKIVSIYEGTCGIQAADLLGRKLPMNEGRAFKALLNQMMDTVKEAKTIDSLKALADKAQIHVTTLGETAMTVGMNAADPKMFKTAFAHSLPLLDVVGDTIMTWMLLWRAVTASKKLANNPNKKDLIFYNGQITTARFFIETAVPTSLGKMSGIKAMSTAAMDMETDAYAG